MAFNPLLFVGATAGVGAIAGLAAASVSSGGSLPSLPSLPGAGSLGRLFSTRSQQNFKSAEWINKREAKVNEDNLNRIEILNANRDQRFKDNKIIFPYDLGKNFLKMTFSKYQRSAPNEEVKSIPEQTIFLPVPANLKDATSLQYNHNPLGFLPGVGEQAYERGSFPSASGREASFIGSQFMGAGLLAASSLVGGISGLSGPIGAAVSGLSTTLAGAAGVAASEGVRRAFSAQMGLTLNPFNAVTFENVNFKHHQFQWKFLPNSEIESEVLKLLQRALSTFALPAKGDLTFEYPYTVSLQFHPTDQFLYKFKRCFLQSFAFDYAPSQVPAFFRNGAPVEVSLSMNFIEIEIWTSNDYDRGPSQAPERPRGPPGDTGNTIPESLRRAPETTGSPGETIGPGPGGTVIP